MDFAAPAALRSRLGAWAGRRFVKRLRKKGIDASTLALLPDTILTQFARDGLDPVPGARPAEGAPGMVKESLPFGMDAWVVTGYDEVRQILGAGGEFSNDFTRMAGAEAAGVHDQHPGGLGVADPPVHTRLRRILTPEFTVRRLRRLGPLIDGIVEDQLRGIAEAGAASADPVDLVSRFAWPIPSLTICELLGVSPEDRDEFQRLSTERFDLSTGLDAALGSISTSLSHLEKIVETQRKDPGEGLLGMIVRDHGDTVSDEELVGLADGVLTGGLETSASMLALGSLVLLQNPEVADAVREDDSLVDGLVEELLRYLSVVQMAFPRFARRDIEVNGQTIREGDIVLCSLLQANRSEELTEGAGLFDAVRSKNSHLAFGHGIHRCVGAELARMELRAAYPALLRRFPKMQLAVPASELDFRKLSIVYGLETLPVTLG